MLAIWVATGTGSAKAQIGGGSGGVSTFGGQGGFSQQTQAPFLGPLGGGTAITVDESYLYIVRGSQVFKLKKTDLTLVASSMLPMPPNMRSDGVRLVPPGSRPGAGVVPTPGGAPSPVPPPDL